MSDPRTFSSLPEDVALFLSDMEGFAFAKKIVETYGLEKSAVSEILGLIESIALGEIELATLPAELEELGIKKEEIRDHRPLGIFKAKKIGPLGYKIVEFAETTLSSEEIIDRHREAYRKYLDLCGQEIPEKEACKQVAEEFGCGDCWEHSSLLRVYSNTSDIDFFISTISSVDSIDEKNYIHHQKCGIGVGALLLVADHFALLG